MKIDDLTYIISGLTKAPPFTAEVTSNHEKIATIAGCLLYIGALRGFEEIDDFVNQRNSIHSSDSLQQFLTDRRDIMFRELFDVLEERIK